MRLTNGYTVGVTREQNTKRKGRTMTTRLTKTRGTTTDTRGCEFEYTCYSAPAGYRWTRGGRFVRDMERRYVADGLGVEAETLAELRRQVGEK